MRIQELFSQWEPNNYFANEYQLIMQPIKIDQLLSHWASPSYLTNTQDLII